MKAPATLNSNYDSIIAEFVVINVEATEAAFCRAQRVTLAGSMIPASNILMILPFVKSIP